MIPSRGLIGFRDEFLTYMGEQLATTFSTKNVLAMFEERYTILDPLLDDQLERWNSTRKKYNSELKKLISYAEERPMKLMMYFAGTKYLNLSTEEMYHYFGKAKEVAPLMYILAVLFVLKYIFL